MSGVTLHRSNSARNLRRFYRLDVQPDLFGQWCFIREWGRVGSAGQARTVPHPTPDAAEAALARLRRATEHRGYTPNWTGAIAEGMPTISCVIPCS
jgi:predicted DNA-binding WGR domain protein